MITAFLTQFPPGAFEIHERTFLTGRESIERALAEIVASPGIVFHALVSPEHKRSVVAGCTNASAPHCDLTGRFVEFLARESGFKPIADPRRLHHVDEAYHRRIEAIEFAMQHDDGLGLDTLHQGDLVLVGVSRTSKTPTTIYLAQMGYRAGNYALAMGVEPPKELLALPRQMVVGLHIDPDELVAIRGVRQREWNMGQTRYNDPEQVRREVQWSRQLYARQGWKTLDVTNRAIEETAARILDVVGLARPPSG
jgi:regulator of PEP synthase PpsR (kinase-PPPase family)